MSYKDQIAEDARLYILTEIAGQIDERLNVILVERLLEAKYGLGRSREWVETQMRKLAELGAIELIESAVLIGKLCRPGREHLAMKSTIAGITRPSEIE